MLFTEAAVPFTATAPVNLLYLTNRWKVWDNLAYSGFLHRRQTLEIAMTIIYLVYSRTPETEMQHEVYIVVKNKAVGKE